MINQPALLEKGLELPIMEEFYSIQGEGHFTGEPSYFIRIGGCDVGCHWCDVKESWNPKLHPVKKIEDTLKQALSFPSKTIIVTGGEPTLYNLLPLTELLKQHNFSTHIETSGSEKITGKWDWICVSPKKNAPPLNENLVLANELKVIIYNKNDFQWAEKIAADVNNSCLLYLQPEWSKKDKIIPEIIQYVLQHPRWKLSLQTHKYIGIP